MIRSAARPVLMRARSVRPAWSLPRLGNGAARSAAPEPFRQFRAVFVHGGGGYPASLAGRIVRPLQLQRRAGDGVFVGE